MNYYLLGKEIVQRNTNNTLWESVSNNSFVNVYCDWYWQSYFHKLLMKSLKALIRHSTFLECHYLLCVEELDVFLVLFIFYEFLHVYTFIPPGHCKPNVSEPNSFIFFALIFYSDVWLTSSLYNNFLSCNDHLEVKVQHPKMI